jgi:hypothetical protein
MLTQSDSHKSEPLALAPEAEPPATITRLHFTSASERQASHGSHLGRLGAIAKLSGQGVQNMTESPDYEARASQADGFAEVAHSAAAAQEWRQIAAEYRLLAEHVAVEVADQTREEQYIGFSA